MSLLSELLKSEPQDHMPATPATFATQESKAAQSTGKSSANSKSSKGPEGRSETYTRLLALAGFEALPAELVHRLSTADLKDVADATDMALTAFLYALADTADREAGRVPPSHTGAILCRHCGPVYVSPDVARVLPVVGDWPTAVGCPWCHVSNRLFPRPPE